jgi:hypothetical protein
MTSPSISAAGIVFAANQRETNLQRTSTAIIVAGIDGATRHRSHR